MRKTSTTLIALEEAPESRNAIVCVPQAGAGAASFLRLAHSLRGESSVWAARFPGRESRVLESPLTTIESMADSLFDPVKSIDADSMILLGHCSGALVAYELAHKLRHHVNRWNNFWLAVSGQSPPPVSSEPRKTASSLSLLELAERLRAMGGTPEDLLENTEFMELLAPALQADFDAVAQYHVSEHRDRLSMSILALGGAQDQALQKEALIAWESRTARRFRLKMLDGRHFFLAEQTAAVREVLISIMTSAT